MLCADTRDSVKACTSGALQNRNSDKPRRKLWVFAVLAGLGLIVFSLVLWLLHPIPAYALQTRQHSTAVFPVFVGQRTVPSPPASPDAMQSIAGDAVGSVAAGISVKRGLIVLAGVLFVAGAALAAAETAITTLWPWKVRELAEKEGERSPFALLEKDLTRFLTTILVATTSTTIFSTAIATDVAGDIFGTAAVGYVTAGLTVFFLFFGEILPKALAVHAPAKIARVIVPFISGLSTIVYPVGKILASFSSLILRLFKLPMESNASVSEEELRLIVAGADSSGSIEKYESQIIKNVLDLEETAVRAVMCPRVDIVALDATNTLSDLLVEESNSHYSRMPVYDSSIDNIIGVVFAKSLLRYLNGEPDALDKTHVAEIMDPPFFVPESMSVWKALEEMRRRRLHMAIVVDEYGGTAGVVTLEDILEEVVGEIYDEDDDIEAETVDVAKAGDGRFVIDGQAELQKVGEILMMELTEDDLRDYGTISGFLCARMGGIPEVGDSTVYDCIRFTVTEADDRRILKLRSSMLTAEEMQSLHAQAEELAAQDAATADADTMSGESHDETVMAQHECNNTPNCNDIGAVDDKMRHHGLQTNSMDEASIEAATSHAVNGDDEPSYNDSSDSRANQ